MARASANKCHDDEFREDSMALELSNPRRRRRGKVWTPKTLRRQQSGARAGDRKCTLSTASLSRCIIASKEQKSLTACRPVSEVKEVGTGLC